MAAAGLSVLSACGGGGGEGGNDSGKKPPIPEVLLPAESLVRYGPHERQVADVYYPQIDTKDIKGVALWIHGGGWVGGKKMIPNR